MLHEDAGTNVLATRVFARGEVDTAFETAAVRVGGAGVIEEGAEAARRTAVALLSTLKSEVGNLDRVGRIVKLLCMVNCTPDFAKQSVIADGASNLMVDAFGERGRHARSAVGMASLPFGMAVEIELVAAIED